jgi:hypothetical protein
MLSKPPTPPPEPTEAARLVATADRQAATNPRAALDAYQQVLRDHAKEPELPRALYGLAKLQADPSSPTYDRKGAYTLFDRLLKVDPTGPYARDARAWRAVLSKLEKCETSTAKLEDRLNQLKELDIDIERAP